MIPGIEDDPEPPKPAPAGAEKGSAGRPMVHVSLGFYHYLQDCADLVSAMSTDPRPLNRGRALEWRLAARAIQIAFGKLNDE